ncbi:MAG TPA: DNA primase [Acidimicrobiales bacterium]|nr:DNA primase [Acidimicrobiales bacterium]
MGIVDEDVARVRAATDFVQVASQHIALKKVGRRWTGLCPFHAEKTPSFSVNAEEGLYYCFGCQAKGDVITFVREVEHLDFVEAVERLATAAGIELRRDDAKEGKDRQRRSVLTEAMEKAVEWYHQRLLTSPDAAGARGYLRSRGYDGEVVRAFRLGWAPDDWDALVKALKLPVDVLKDTGLGFVNKADRQQDAFRARIMFPIFDVNSKPVAFGGRKLEGDGPKYKNSPETPLYSKSRTLYGLNWSKPSIVEAGEVIVCEGYTDVIAFFTAGMPRAVATCGTALADEHFRTLKNFARRVVLAYDADSAGQTAAERFYEWEQRYEVDLAVAALPEGSDPGDVARKAPEDLRTAVAEATPFLSFRLHRALSAGDLRTAEGRARAAEAALNVVGEHPNPLVRDQYLMEIADRTRIDVDRLREGIGRRGARPEVKVERPAGFVTQSPAETMALRLAIHQPEEMAPLLDEVLFSDELHVAAYRALASAATLHDAVASADPGAAALLQRLAVEDAEAEPLDVISILVIRATDQTLPELVAEAARTGHVDGTMAWAKLTIEQLALDSDIDPGTRKDAVTRLVAWLAERGGPQP